MNRPLTIALLAAGLLVLPAAAAHALDAKGHWDSIPAQKRDAGLEKAGDQGLFAKLTYTSDGWARGAYVEFQLATGTVLDFSVRNGESNVSFFESITPTDYEAQGDPYTTGAILHSPSPTMDIRVHNNPTALTVWESHHDGLSLVFRLAENATIANQTAKEVRVNAGGVHGHILTSGGRALNVSANSVLVALDFGERAMFRAHLPAGPQTADLHDQNAAFRAGTLGSVLGVVDGGGVAIEDREQVDVYAETRFIKKGRVEVETESLLSANRIVFVSIGGDTLDPAQLDRLRIQLDGHDVPKVADYAALLGSSREAAYVSSGDTYVKIALYVPPASLQTFVITQSEKSGTPGPEAWLVVAGAMLSVAALRRREV